MFKPLYKEGDRVRILYPNAQHPEFGIDVPGGRVSDEMVGRVVTLVEYSPNGGMKGWGIKNWKGPTGYWRTNSGYVFNEACFEHADKKENEVKEKPVDYQAMLLPDLRKLAVKERVPYRGVRKNELVALLQNKKAAAPKPIPPLPKVEDEFACGKELVKRVNGTHNTCSFAYDFGKKDNSVYHVFAPCHAALNYGNYVGCKNVVLDVSGHHFSMGKNPLYKEWVEYWLNDSPMAPVFTTKKFEEALEHGIYIDATKYGTSSVAVAAIGLREGSEFQYSGRLENFSLLKEAGVHPRVAWLLSCNFSNDFNFVPWSGAHQVFGLTRIKLDNLFLWLKTGRILNDSKPMSLQKTYYAVTNAISEQGKEEAKDFANLLGVKIEGDGWNKRYSRITEKKLLIAAGKLTQIIGL